MNRVQLNKEACQRMRKQKPCHAVSYRTVVCVISRCAVLNDARPRLEQPSVQYEFLKVDPIQVFVTTVSNCTHVKLFCPLK